MSIWDDPDMQDSSDYVKFETVGDSVAGRIVSIGKHEFPDGKIAAKLLIDVGDGEIRTMTAGQFRLAAALRDHRPNVGDTIAVKFTSVEKLAAGKTLKHFDVKVTRAEVESPKAPF